MFNSLNSKLIMIAKVWTYKSNGNDFYQKSIDLTKVREHVYYYEEKLDSCSFPIHHLVLENENVFINYCAANLENIKNKITWDYFLGFIERVISSNGYLNNITLKLVETISPDLLKRAIAAREIYLKTREEGELREQEEKREKEEKKLREQEEEEKKKDHIITSLQEIGLLKENLTKMQRGKVLTNLEKVSRFEDNKGRSFVCSIYELIMEHGFNKLSKWSDTHTRWGEERKKAVNHYSLQNKELGYGYSISGNLGMMMVATED